MHDRGDITLYSGTTAQSWKVVSSAVLSLYSFNVTLGVDSCHWCILHHQRRSVKRYAAFFPSASYLFFSPELLSIVVFFLGKCWTCSNVDWSWLALKSWALRTDSTVNTQNRSTGCSGKNGRLKQNKVGFGKGTIWIKQQLWAAIIWLELDFFFKFWFGLCDMVKLLFSAVILTSICRRETLPWCLFQALICLQNDRVQHSRDRTDWLLRFRSCQTFRYCTTSVISLLFAHKGSRTWF